MKFLSVFVVLCLVAYSTQIPLYDECEQKIFGEQVCMTVKCISFKNETHQYADIRFESCPFARCEEGQEFKGETPGDETAVYPGCCSTPICE